MPGQSRPSVSVLKNKSLTAESRSRCFCENEVFTLVAHCYRIRDSVQSSSVFVSRCSGGLRAAMSSKPEGEPWGLYIPDGVELPSNHAVLFQSLLNCTA
jgi:hypothetical protein